MAPFGWINKQQTVQQSYIPSAEEIEVVSLRDTLVCRLSAFSVNNWQQRFPPKDEIKKIFIFSSYFVTAYSATATNGSEVSLYFRYSYDTDDDGVRDEKHWYAVAVDGEKVLEESLSFSQGKLITYYLNGINIRQKPTCTVSSATTETIAAIYQTVNKYHLALDHEKDAKKNAESDEAQAAKLREEEEREKALRRKIDTL